MDRTGLLIDYGNGASKHFVNLPWTEGTYVTEVVDAAQAVTPGFETDTSSNFRVGTHLLGVDGLQNDDSASWVIWNGREELDGWLAAAPPHDAYLVGAGDEVALRYTTRDDTTA